MVHSDNYADHDYGTNNEYEISYFYFVFLTLLLSSLLFQNIVHTKWKIEWFPEAAAPLVIGMISGLICHLHYDAVTQALLSFDPTVFFVALLPPIIFNSGYSMKRRYFFQNFTSILTFAIIGTFISTLLVGMSLYMIGQMQWTIELSLAECLTFGALISATDPVSTLAIFQQLRVDPQLFYLVFGESVLNDAVAIVLFRTFSKFIGYTHTLHSIVVAALDFFLIFFGSTMIGLFMGLLSALLFKYFNFRKHYSHEMGAVLLFSYLPFLVAEAVEMSGIVSILFAGISMKHYTHNNLSHDAQINCISLFQLISSISETAVFLRLTIFARREGYHIYLVLWSLLTVIIARAMHIYPLSYLLNCRRSIKISSNQQHMLCFSGLRGAIAFALSLSFPGNHRSEIISTTMSIVICTVFFMGGATVRVLQCLKIPRLTLAEEVELDAKTQPSNTMAILRFDAKFLMPFFTHNTPRIVRAEETSPDPFFPVELGTIQEADSV